MVMEPPDPVVVHDVGLAETAESLRQVAAQYSDRRAMRPTLTFRDRTVGGPKADLEPCSSNGLREPQHRNRRTTIRGVQTCGCDEYFQRAPMNPAHPREA